MTAPIATITHNQTANMSVQQGRHFVAEGQKAEISTYSGAWQKSALQGEALLMDLSLHPKLQKTPLQSLRLLHLRT